MVCGPQYCSNKPKNSDVICQSSISMNLLTESAFWFKDLGIHWTDNSMLFRVQNSKIQSLLGMSHHKNCHPFSNLIRYFCWDLSLRNPFHTASRFDFLKVNTSEMFFNIKFVYLRLYSLFLVVAWWLLREKYETRSTQPINVFQLVHLHKFTYDYPNTSGSPIAHFNSEQIIQCDINQNGER